MGSLKDKNWHKLLIPSEVSIREAMERINEHGGKGLFVVDTDLILVGSLTDGDIRRALLKGISIQEPIYKAMKSDLIWASEHLSNDEKQRILLEKNIQSLPVLDAQRKVIEIFVMDRSGDCYENPVVLLAGGMGTRLGKITQNLPKPMVEVAGKPILEHIINRFVEQGFKNFFLSVNYKADVIENYFSSGDKFKCHIEYLRESKRLGTAGPMSLLPHDLKGPLVVMNGDLLTQVNLSQLLRFHMDHHASITMCVREYEINIPFGVVETDDGFVRSFHEKPSRVFKVNAGIYVIDADIARKVPKDEYFDMSSLLNLLLEENIEIACFPIIERWIDVGRESDLDMARSVYSKDDE